MKTKLIRGLAGGLVGGLTSVLLLTSCGKQIEMLNRFGNHFQVPVGPACQVGDRMRWEWEQPGATVNHKVDLLFVVDTSLSLIPERSRLAKAIPHFLNQMPADADTRIAVMLAHGTNSWSGHLYSKPGRPAVINPAAMPAGEAAKILHDNLSCPPLDFGVGNGEMLLYSLQRSLETKHFAEARALGFFRDDAALSVVFVTDENDICYNPPDHGYTKFPDYNEHGAWLEQFAYREYCINHKTHALQVTPASVLARLQNRLPGRKISLAGIVHIDPAHVKSVGEDSIGHGIIETVKQVPDGLLFDVVTGNYDAGLEQLATVSTSQLALMTSFPLDSEDQVDPQSILVSVDGMIVTGEFDAETRTVQIAGSDAGGAHSQVDISACPLAPHAEVQLTSR